MVTNKLDDSNAGLINDADISQSSKNNVENKIYKTAIVLTVALSLGVMLSGWIVAKAMSKNWLESGGHQVKTSEVTSVELDAQTIARLPSIGRNDAPVTIVEFLDYMCPYCQEWHQKIYPKLKKEYIDTGIVRFIVWDFPMLGQDSVRSAIATECSNKQGKYWDYQYLLFQSRAKESSARIDDELLNDLAQSLNLNLKEFAYCLESESVSNALKTNMTAASRAGVSATPSLLINGDLYEGLYAWDKYSNLINQYLK